MADNYDFIPAETSTGDTASNYDFVPAHQFDYSPIQASTKDRDELANMWMAKTDFLGGHGPQTREDLNAITSKASSVGMSLDDVMAAAQEKMTPSERASVQRFRYAGPLGRGIVQSENSTATFLTNAAYRGLSFVPGYEHFADKADENNRALDTAGAVIDQLNREGSMADIIGPTGASLMGTVGQGLMDVATISAVPGVAAGATEEMTAEAAASANTAAALSASKKAAIFFGVKQGEHQLTVGTDAGLSPNSRIANAAVSGSITGVFTYGFGQWAQQLGLATSEQAAVAGSGAVGRLMTREGLTEAAQSYALSAGEQAAMSTAEQAWGSVIGTDTMDDWASRTGKAGVTGAIMRGSMDVLPAARDFHEKFTAVQEKLPETVKGTLAAQNVVFKGEPAKRIENESPTYQEAYKSEIAALEQRKAEAMASLDEIKSGQETLKTRIEKHLAAKRDADALSSGGLTEDMKQQLRDMGVSEQGIANASIGENQKPNKATGTGPGTEAEQAAIRAERDKLAEQHKKIMGDATAADKLIEELKVKSAAVPPGFKTYDEFSKWHDDIQGKIDSAVDAHVAAGSTLAEAYDKPDVKPLQDAATKTLDNVMRHVGGLIENDVAEDWNTWKPSVGGFKNPLGDTRKIGGQSALQWFLKEHYDLSNGNAIFLGDKLLDQPKRIKAMARDIYEMWSEANGLDAGSALGPQSGLTADGKQAIVSEARQLAEKIDGHVSAVLSDKSLDISGANRGDISAAVPFMITKVMRQKLVEMGHSPEEIANMSPQNAHDAIKAGAEAAAAGHEQVLSEMSDADKSAATSKVINDLETKRTSDGLEQGKVELTRAEHELNRKFREYHGMEALPDAQRITMEASLREARAKGMVGDADNIAKDILSKGRGLSYDEQNALMDAMVGRKELRELADEILQDPNATEDAKRDAAVTKDSVRKSEDVISRAIFEGRSDVARTLGTGQYDNTNPATVRETGRRRKGSDLSPQEADSITAGAEKVQEIEERARRAAAANETEATKPLTREGFAFRETLRAEQRSGRALTKAEADSVAAAARKLYDTASDPIAMDNARMHESAADLYHEANKARMALEVQMLKLEPKTFGSQVQKGAAIVGGLTREYLTGGDGPPNLRQGLLHPLAWPEMLTTFVKSGLSDRGESHADYALSRRKYYHEALASGLRLLKVGEPFQFQEGGMADAMAQRFPIFRRISGAYRTSVNAVRMYAFEVNVDSQGGISKWDATSLKRCADFSNCATGTGTLGGLENSAGFLSHIMLAPRFFWSRMQYFTGWPMLKAAYAGDKVASQMMLKAYAKQVCGIAAVTALAEIGGNAAFGPGSVKFYRNPLSSDPDERFNVGRMRVGNTMIDVTAALFKPFRYATSLAEPLLAAYQNRPSLKRADQTLLGIAGGTLAPIPSALISSAEVYSGSKDANGELQKYIMPWTWNDMHTAFQNEGLDKASAIAVMSMFGANGYTLERNK